MEPTHPGNSGQILKRYLVRKPHPHGFERADNASPPQRERRRAVALSIDLI
jgi:hypothetical protein